MINIYRIIQEIKYYFYEPLTNTEFSILWNLNLWMQILTIHIIHYYKVSALVPA
jgi:hypothetical protein